MRRLNSSKSRAASASRQAAACISIASPRTRRSSGCAQTDTSCAKKCGAGERLVRAWLAKGNLRAAPEAVIDGSWYEPWTSPLQVESVEVNDLFSAGSRVAFHVTQRGPGPEGALALRCVGLARVEAGEVRAVRAITDRARRADRAVSCDVTD